MKLTHNQFPFLDGFRAIGILMIVGHHMCVGLDLYHLFANDPPILTWILFKAWQFLRIDLSYFYVSIEHMIYHFKGILGVQLFFIISGFLITRGLLEMKGTWQDVCRFWIRRFFRIYPAYALLVIVSLALFAWQAKISVIDALVMSVQYLFFLQNYFPRHFYLEHLWTLAIFEQFYIAYPVIILIIYRCVASNEARRRILLIVLIVLMGVGSWAKYTYLVLGKPLISWPLAAPYPYFTLTYHLGPLCLGCMLAVLKPLWREVPQNKILGGILWALGALGYYVLFFVVDWGYSWGKWYMNILGYLSGLSLLAAAFLGVSFITCSKWMQWLGRHSYGIYLWHILVISAWARGLTFLPPSVVVIGTLISCLAVGVISSLTIERFFLNLRERYK